MQTEGLSSFVSYLVRMRMEMRMRKRGGRDPTGSHSAGKLQVQPVVQVGDFLGSCP